MTRYMHKLLRYFAFFKMNYKLHFAFKLFFAAKFLEIKALIQNKLQHSLFVFF